MSIKFEKIVAGMRLLDIHRERMGNTTMSAWGSWDVKILSVDVAARTAVVSWNGNPARIWREHQLTKLYTKETKALLEQQARRRNGSLF